MAPSIAEIDVQSSFPNGRRTERVVPTNEVIVQLNGSDTILKLYDLSLGGFAILSGRPFAPGMTHRFTFTAPSDQVTVTIVAKAIHSRAAPDDQALRFITGWEFMFGRSEDERTAIARLFQAATGRPS